MCKKYKWRKHIFYNLFIRYFLHLHFKCYRERPLYPPPTLIPNPPTPNSWPWHSPVLGHIIFARPRASPPNDGRLGHLLLHMQLETGAQGVLFSSYCCSSYRFTDPFSSLSTFSSAYIGDGNGFYADPVLHLCHSASMPTSVVPLEASRETEVKPKVTHAKKQWRELSSVCSRDRTLGIRWFKL